MASTAGFHKALDIYIHRPQVVNRRCGGASIISSKDVTNNPQTWAMEITEVCHAVASHGGDKSCQLVPSAALLSSIDCLTASLSTPVKVTVRKLISKQSSVLFPYEVILSDSSVYHFIPVEISDGQLFPVGVIYSFRYDAETHSLTIDTTKQVLLSCTTTSQQWLTTVLLPKLIKWAQSEEQLSDSAGNKSMKVIDIGKYYSKYTFLKDKYGKAITEIWPECTDPLKFVYEDVAIACYLICLWEEEQETMGLSEKQTFVDLGCGNGLLVYILSDQGYSGYGIDVRKRRIWDLLRPVANLREFSLIPSQSGLFPDADWLIGNHSDELTPWIPVMAARSSRSCRFFVLPCCPHDFYSKYQRIDASQSVYSECLKYIHHVASQSGFLCRSDSLRIPSTRKECIIGSRNSQLTDDDYRHIDMSITKLIGQSSENLDKQMVGKNSSTTVTSSSHLSQDIQQCHQPTFTPRSRVEPVMNCATVERSVQQQIVDIVTEELLSTANYISAVTEDGERSWNTGGTVSLTLVARLLTENGLLGKLKSECGGLKTLLKNHHHIFTVEPGAKVRLSRFSTDLKETTSLASSRLKTKLCWFHQFHPDGCLLSGPLCRYAHGSSDLRLHTH